MALNRFYGTSRISADRRLMEWTNVMTDLKEIFPIIEEAEQIAYTIEDKAFRKHPYSFNRYKLPLASELLVFQRQLVSTDETSRSVALQLALSYAKVVSGKNLKPPFALLSNPEKYNELLKYILKEDELMDNGYFYEIKNGVGQCSLNPDLKHDGKIIKIHMEFEDEPNVRRCRRCNLNYKVDLKTLKQVTEGPGVCSFHPGRKTFNPAFPIEAQYTCCNRSRPCTTHVRHVHQFDYATEVPECVITKPRSGFPGVYALDCGIVYTLVGTEVAKVTVVDIDKNVVYESLVKPEYRVECYDTKYSGITEEILGTATKTLADVQKDLLEIFSDTTILIGHSLQNDLKALKIIHSYVCDSSVTYFGTLKRNFKSSLRALSNAYLNPMTYGNDIDHDTRVDACLALDLILRWAENQYYEK